jgi:L-histidine N-alpha-methyltransferase
MTSLTKPTEWQLTALADVHEGLRRRQKELPSKYFYDLRGSQLFEQITHLPEYYLTRAERRVLREWMPTLMRTIDPSTLVELGAGSGEKTRLILRAMRDAGSGRTYVPIDVSAAFLDESAERLRLALPWLEVAPVVADFTAEFSIGEPRPGTTLFAFLGSTIGNFDERSAEVLLRRVRGAMRADDRFLLGADLHTKETARIVRAYNDCAGVTAEFNLNILRVVNRELGTDFDVDAFEHRAFWEPAHRRIEMHLVATQRTSVTLPQCETIHIEAGESIRTEICGKYDRGSLASLLARADLEIESWRVDPGDQYAMLVAAPTTP